MVERDTLLAWTNEVLQPETFRDACPNGIQVYGKESVGLIATCVSVSEKFFQQAVDAGADMLLVHHGLFWEGASRVIDPWMARRLGLLLKSQANLVAYHLPLDAHAELGNNARLADLLELVELDYSFGHYKGMAIGCRGELASGQTLDMLIEKVSHALDSHPLKFGFGGQKVSRVGIVSGGGGDVSLLQEAKIAGCDTFVTGEIFEQSVAMARELKLNVLVLGHYNSEKLGVRALGDALAEKFLVDIVHMDVPNPI